MHRHTCLSLVVLLLACVSASGETEQEKELFIFINSERSRVRLELLQWDKSLYRVAVAHSKDMAGMRKVTHKGSDNTQPHDRVRGANIFASKTAENIAGDINIISAHTSLMKSLYHRENILDPDFSHGAVAVQNQDGYLYITEVFIRKVGDYAVEEARRLILDQMNRLRQDHNLPPLAMSKSLSGVAQSHVDVQIKLGAMSPLLIMSVLSRQMKSSLLVNVYTTSDLKDIPEELRSNVKLENKQIGIGFKRARGSICLNGCYVIALIFGSNMVQPKAGG